MTVSPAEFEAQRGRLLRLAYRMLGTVSDAEDVLQEAWLRLAAAEDVQDAQAFLLRVVVRLCLDHLKSARVKRETYPGTWLPEPWIDVDPEARDVSVALLLALERLSPLERAAFVLHDLFDRDFAEVAALLERSEDAVRQLAARARRSVQSERPRFPLDPERARAIGEAFAAASRSGDVEVLGRMLREDVRLVSDGGGKRPAATRDVVGRDRVQRFLRGVSRAAGELVHAGLINGAPGFVVRNRDGLPTVTVLEVEDGLVAWIYVIRNPEKLGKVGLEMAPDRG